jgi:peptide/nickel transport system permease protein
MLEVIRSDYITTARSKGLTENEVIMKHALPNAMIPIITILGAQFGQLLGGSLIIETIFNIPGMGSYMISGINNRDYPVVQSCVVVLGIVFCICMLLVDIAYAYIDPRIKAQYADSGKRRAKS